MTQSEDWQSEQDKLREAMALAMREVWRDRGQVRDETLEWPDIEDADREDWLAQADAALAVVREALREPMPAMERAFHDAETEDAAIGVPADTARANNERLCRAVWPAMLAASALRGSDG